MKLGVVIVSFNVKDLMTATLSTLKTSLDFAKKDIADFDYEVVVVDNSSTDGVVDIIKKDYKWVKLIENTENLGFSKANNIGVNALNTNSNYVLFLNNDVRLEDNTIVMSLNYILSHKNVGVLTCRVDLYSGGLDWDCHRAFPNVWNSFCYFYGLEKSLGNIFPSIFGRYHLMDKDINSIHEIDLCLGAFMLLPYEIGEQINWWPEDYFMNGEDVDLCYQIKKILGYKVVYYPETRIIHYKGAAKGTKKVSEGITTASDKTKAMVIKAGSNAMEIFYDKYYAKKNNFIINFVVKLGIKTMYLLRRFTKKE